MYDAQLLVCASAKDLPWLSACLRSVQKFWTGSQNPIVVLTPDCRSDIPRPVTELHSYVTFRPKEDHPYVRLTADSYMSAALVMFVDSHDMFIRPCDLSTFTDLMRRPVLTVEPYSATITREEADESCVQNRRWVIDEVTGTLPAYEYTYRAPMLFYRQSIRRMREAIEKKNKRPLADLMQNFPSEYWSEYNFLGSHCHEKETSSYSWLPCTESYTPSLRRFTGVTDPTRGEDLQEIRKILA